MQIIEGGTGGNDDDVSVRQYDASRDKEDFVTVFKETADAAFQKPELLTIGSYIWCRAYIALEPAYCFALAVKNTTSSPGPDDPIASTSQGLQDRAIGYILCTPSTLPFLSRWNSDYLPNIVAKEGQCDRPVGDEERIPGEFERDPAMAMRRMVWYPKKIMVTEAYPRLLEDYPAHLHIDIRADYRRHGGGRALMDALFAKLRAEKVRGIHLEMGAHNINAGKFYEAIGFARFEEKLGGAKDGILHEGGITYVKKIN